MPRLSLQCGGQGREVDRKKKKNLKKKLKKN